MRSRVHSVMAFLFLAAFCLFSVLLCSTSYSVPIESIGRIDIEGNGVVWNHGSQTYHSGLRAPGIFGNLAAICSAVSQARIQKLICVFCKGFDLSCFLPPTSPPPILPPFIPVFTTTTPTTPVTSTIVSSTTPAGNITTTPTTAAKSDMEPEEE